MLTSPFAICLRRLTRKLGLNRLLGGWLAGRHYEDHFGLAFQAAIRPGDTVWDIGANVGLYTAIFAKATGSTGLVVAFEPTAACFSELQGRFANNPQVLLKNIALGASDGSVLMAVDTNALAATHRVVADNSVGGGLVQVQVRSAAALVAEEPELFPRIVKIDVEGHEGAVLDGFEALLPDQRLHTVGIEVHFGLLDERGESYRPSLIEQTLVQHCFNVRWTDPSHLLARR
jgi:FkbM family methyltransferase